MLWRLTWRRSRVTCAIYRAVDGASLELRIESSTATILAEPFEMQPRGMTRVHALRRSLERRGWREAAV